MAKSKILIVDDDQKLLATLTALLEEYGFSVLTATDGPGALDAFQSATPDLVVLDVTLPPTSTGTGDPADGLEVLNRIRRHGSVPVLMLSKTTIATVKVMALDMGADDYITKPFDPRELVARVRAILRRGGPDGPGPTCIEHGRLRIDPDARTVWKDGKMVDLTTKEFEVLMVLARRPGRVFTRDVLFELAWGPEHVGIAKAIDVHVGNIRKKLGDDPTKPEFITTVRGMGYRFETPPKHSPADL